MWPRRDFAAFAIVAAKRYRVLRYGLQQTKHLVVQGCHQKCHFHRQRTLAPTPLCGRLFLDAIYAVSVLTHLSAAQQDAWINELRRVLHPSGCLILTTNGEQSATILLPKELARFRNEGIVIRSGVDEGRRCFLAYHHPEYVRTHLFSGLQIYEHIPGFAEADTIGQDIWVLRKID